MQQDPTLMELMRKTNARMQSATGCANCDERLKDSNEWLRKLELAEAEVRQLKSTMSGVIAKVERDDSWDRASLWFEDGMGMNVDGIRMRMVCNRDLPDRSVSLIGCTVRFERFEGRWNLVGIELPKQEVTNG